MKGFLIAAPGSGSGKTTISAALMAALKNRGLTVQPFKCGPDFIDPGHHARICGRPSHNLDTWMLPAETNRRIFARSCRDADVALVEGMMGLFDGLRGAGEAGSSAEIAKLLGLPVVLVVDASAAARSIAALVYGFQRFDPSIRISAVILNRVANQRHAEMLIEALKEHDRELLVGWVQQQEEIKLKERYLGLQTAEERSWTTDQIELLASSVERNVPLDRILESCAVDLPQDFREPPQPAFDGPARIGIARDCAFCFYYEAGLEELRRHGAELVEFSPLASPHLPDHLHALYFGGGYPELYAELLSDNTSLLSEIREFAAAGKLIYGECGGLMFLSKELITRDGKVWPMTGLLPLSIQMTDRLVHFGYTDVRFTKDGVAPENMWLRGHSFHCSQITHEEKNIQKTTVVHYSLSGNEQPEGFAVGNVFGSYIHLHFAADPSFVAHFMSLARMACLHGEVNP